MFGVLLLAFFAVPIAELAVLVQVGSTIGTLPTLAVVVAVSVVGAWLAKQQGLFVWRRIRTLLAEGIVPGSELTDGLLILVAGALLLTPGFITDAVALLLLLPPVRALVRHAVRRRFEDKVTRTVVIRQPPL